jgi:hypothetical protein
MQQLGRQRTIFGEKVLADFQPLKPIKNVTRTIRIDDDLDLALQERARDERVSVSFLINRLVRKNINWDIPSQELGFVQLPSGLIMKLYENIDVDALEKLGRWTAREYMEPLGRLIMGVFDFNSSVEIFRRMSTYGGQFGFEGANNRRNRNIVLRYNGDRKTAAYLIGLLRGVYQDILRMEAEIEAKQNFCIAMFANS